MSWCSIMLKFYISNLRPNGFHEGEEFVLQNICVGVAIQVSLQNNEWALDPPKKTAPYRNIYMIISE